MTEIKKPKPTSLLAEHELNKVEDQFQSADKSIKDMTLDRMNAAPRQDEEPQTKLSQKQIEKSKEIYLKPKRSIACRDKFNEDYRQEYNQAKEYVHFVAENKEIIGESIDIWTRPFGGMPAEEWSVPTNTPVWGPRYLAEQIKRKFYHRLIMKQNVVTEQGSYGQMYGSLAVDTTIQRLDAIPVSNRKSIFMGQSSGF
jgi:hypothetical protein